MHTLYTGYWMYEFLEFLNELDYWKQFVCTLGYMKAAAYSKTSYMVSLMIPTWQDCWFSQGKGRRKKSLRPLPWVLARPWLGTSLWFTHVGGQGFSLQVLCLSSGRGMALQYLSSTGVPLSSTHSTPVRFVPTENNIINNSKHKYYYHPFLRKKDRKEKINLFWLERVL